MLLFLNQKIFSWTFKKGKKKNIISANLLINCESNFSSKNAATAPEFGGFAASLYLMLK